MKPLSFLFLFFLFSLLTAQVSIDSVKVKLDSINADSAFVRFTSYLGLPVSVGGLNYTDPNTRCYTSIRRITFRGGLTPFSITKDTIIHVSSPGIYPQLFRLEAVWDTAFSPFPPQPRLLLDTFIYDSCSTVGRVELEKKVKVQLAPNPAQDYFQIKGSSLMEIKSIQVYDIRGQQVAQYHTVQERYYVANLPNGIYLIRMETEQGRMSERLLIQR